MRTFLPYYLCVLLSLSCLHCKAQDMDDFDPTHPVHSSVYGFNALFYQVPIGTIERHDEETNHRWTSKMTDKKHPNQYYEISVWETGDQENTDYATRKAEELIAGKLYDKQLKLMDKSTFNRNITFTYYKFSTPKKEIIHFCIAHTKNRVYVLEIKTRPNEGFNAYILQFTKAFRMELPDEQTLTRGSLDDLSYTINFPFPPSIQISTTPEMTATIAICYTLQEETKLMFSEEVISLDEGMALIKDNKEAAPQLKDSVLAYSVAEMRLENNIPNKEDILSALIYQMLEKDGTLVEQKNIRLGVLEGWSITVRDTDGSLSLFRLLAHQQIVYMLYTKLAYMVKEDCPQAMKFFDSFRIR